MLDRLFRRGARSRIGASADAMSAVPRAKRFAPPPLFAFSGPGVPVWTPRDFAALAREGYARNAVAFRCVRLVAEAAAAIPLILYEGAREADDHPLAALLTQPNPRQGSRVLLETIYGHLLVAGNAYVEAVSVDGRPRELYTLRPDRMRVVPGPDGWPEAYDYCIGAQATRLPLDGVPPAVLHLAGFNPTDDYYGLSPIEAAATALDVHNAASSWNKALLDNSARPSGALVYAPGDGRNLTEAQFERLKEELTQQFEGARNAGRPMLLDGGLDWKALSLTPKDMDFVQAKAMAAREIALAFGVPPMLLGLPGDNTYANYAEANRAFYRSTVLPLVGRVAEAIVQWLSPAYGTNDLRLEPDLDRVEALSSERDGLWARVGGASFLTDAEKRQALGFGAADAGRTLADVEAQEGVAGKDAVGQVKLDSTSADASLSANGRLPGAPEVRLNPFHDAVGRFTFAPGGSANLTRVAQGGSDQYRIDLREEEGKGGGSAHTIERHVNKSDEYLKARVIGSRRQLGIFSVGEKRAGSFSSVEAANKLVNSTLAANKDKIDAFVAGGLLNVLPVQYVYKQFDSPTGTEAYSPNDRTQPTMRPTYGVTVELRRDSSESRGFFVESAYPYNED